MKHHKKSRKKKIEEELENWESEDDREEENKDDGEEEKLDANEGQTQADEDARMPVFDNIFEILFWRTDFFFVLCLYVFGFYFVFWLLVTHHLKNLKVIQKI